MLQPKGWKPFVTNDNEFIWFCLACRQTGIPASKRLGIADEVLALNLDLAVSRRLLVFDRQEAETDRQLLAYEVGKMFIGEPSPKTVRAKGPQPERPRKKK